MGRLTESGGGWCLVGVINEVLHLILICLLGLQ
jgi:hypothetical protein